MAEPSRPRPNPNAPAPSKPAAKQRGFLDGLFDTNTPPSAQDTGKKGIWSSIVEEFTEKPVVKSTPEKKLAPVVAKPEEKGGSGSQPVPEELSFSKQMQAAVSRPAPAKPIAAPESNISALLMQYSLPVMTPITLLVPEDFVNEADVEKVLKFNEHLKIIADEREDAARKHSSLCSIYDATAKRLESLEQSVQFRNVNQLQTDLNKLKETNSSLELKLITANEAQSGLSSSLSDWKKKTEEALAAKRNAEAAKAKLEQSLATAMDDLARTNDLKASLDHEMKSVNLKIEEKVSAVRADFESKMREVQVKLENIQAERNAFAQKSSSLAKELDRLLRASREKSTIEIHKLNLTIEGLNEEVRRKNKSLESANEALGSMFDPNKKFDVDPKTRIEMVEIQTKLNHLKESLQQKNELILTLTKQINEFKATGKIRDFHEANYKSKNTMLDTADLP